MCHVENNTIIRLLLRTIALIVIVVAKVFLDRDSKPKTMIVRTVCRLCTEEKKEDEKNK